MLTAALVAAGACSRHPAEQSFVLRVAAFGPLKPLGPLVHSSHSVLAQPLVFEALMTPDRDGTWRSAVLERWESLPGQRYRLRLRSGLRFSDGTLAATQDLIRSLQAFGVTAREEGGWVYAEAGGNETVERRLRTAVLFKDVHPPLGTGPFGVTSQDADRLVLRRNVPAPNRISEVEFVSFASPRDAFAHLLRGGVNALFTPDTGQVELLNDVPGLRVVSGPGLHAITAVFNSQRLSREERRTLVQSLPVDEIAKAFGPYCARPAGATSFRAPLSGRPLSVVTSPALPGAERVALALRRALGQQGGAFEVAPSPEQFVKALHHGDFDICIMTVQAWPPGSRDLFWHSGPDALSPYVNPKVDAALDDGDFPRAEKELDEDPPALEICRLERVAVLDSRLRNVTLGPYDMLESLPDWKVAP